MGGLRDRIKEYKQFAAEMADNRAKDGLIIASDALALVKRRLINKGEDATNKRFRGYSKKYKALRASLGYPTNIRTHVFSGDMLRDVKPFLASDTKEETVFEIRANSKENDRKLAENSQRMGISLLALSEDEKELVTESNKERILKYKKKYKL